eukprot:scaffold4089_cov26-Prasinocladus_malaysianus.AAC.2
MDALQRTLASLLERHATPLWRQQHQEAENIAGPERRLLVCAGVSEWSSIMQQSAVINRCWTSKIALHNRNFGRPSRKSHDKYSVRLTTSSTACLLRHKVVQNVGHTTAYQGKPPSSGQLFRLS